MTYAPFTKALFDLINGGFVTMMKGKGALGKNPGVTTRIWSTPKFTDHFATAGIMVGNWRSHFDRAFDPTKVPPLRLKARSIRKGGWKLDGRRMEVDFTNPLAAALAEPVRQINAFVAKQDISGAGDVAFFRTFNCGDDRRFGWNMGGRLCCVGGGYQSMKKAQRPLIRINGEDTAELDISGSHLTILYALRGMPLPEGDDPYAGTSLPRHVIKAFVNMTLGHARFHSRWPAEVKERYKEDWNGDLQKDYSIRLVKERVIECLPIMADWPECLITWADLQYTESCIVTAAVHRLAYERDICTLPLHDSLIFPVSKIDIVEQYLSQCFYEYTGLSPNLKIKV